MTNGAGDCTGSVLAFAEFLQEQGTRVVWAYREDPGQVPSGFRGVRAGTARHRWLAARSRWWLTDGLPMRVSGPDTVGRPLERGNGNVAVAFIEPSLERVGSDLVDWPLLTPRRQRLVQIRGEADIDLVVVPAGGIGEVQARALGFTAPVTVDCPLADRVPARDTARASLGLSVESPVVGVVSTRDQEALILGWLAGLGEIAVVSAGTGGRVADVVGACDVLVTDTSGWAAVAARLGRPVVICAPDLRDLLSRGPGLYLPWQHDLPGPWAGDPAALHAAITSLRDTDWSVPEQYRDGHDALAGLVGTAEDGASAELLATLEARS